MSAPIFTERLSGKLLQLLELAGCIITIDAMGCQREIAREIIEAQADYLLAVKENQGRLYDDVRDLFEGAEEYDFEGVPYDFARTLNKGHGRLGTRQCWVITDPDCLDYLQNRQQWANLNAVVKVTAQRETATGTTVHSRYYISSLEACPDFVGGHPPTLGHRKQLALVFGCYLSRRSQPGT